VDRWDYLRFRFLAVHKRQLAISVKSRNLLVCEDEELSGSDFEDKAKKELGEERHALN